MIYTTINSEDYKLELSANINEEGNYYAPSLKMDMSLLDSDSLEGDAIWDSKTYLIETLYEGYLLNGQNDKEEWHDLEEMFSDYKLELKEIFDEAIKMGMFGDYYGFQTKPVNTTVSDEVVEEKELIEDVNMLYTNARSTTIRYILRMHLYVHNELRKMNLFKDKDMNPKLTLSWYELYPERFTLVEEMDNDPHNPTIQVKVRYVLTDNEMKNSNTNGRPRKYDSHSIDLHHIHDEEAFKKDLLKDLD